MIVEAYNSTFISKLDDAKEAYENLNDYDKELVLHSYYVLENAEREFEQNFGALYDIDREIAEVIPTLDTLPYGEGVEALNNLGRKLFDLEEAERNSLLNLSQYNAALTRFGGITLVYNKIDAIGDVTVTSDCKSNIDAARASYDALSAEDKALVDNYDDLPLAEAEYFAMYFLQQTGAKCSVGTGSVDHSEGLSLIWSDLSDKWNALSGDAKALLVAGKAEDSLADFLARYTHIVNRYGVGCSFASGPATQSSAWSNINAPSSFDSDNLAVILIGASCLFVGAFAIHSYRRKSERR